MYSEAMYIYKEKKMSYEAKRSYADQLLTENKLRKDIIYISYY